MISTSTDRQTNTQSQRAVPCLTARATVGPLPLELRLSDTSIPGLVQDVGLLHVANLVAGDIVTSGDKSSRPPMALDDVGMPCKSSLMLKLHYLSLNGSGLNVPWIQVPLAERKPKPSNLMFSLLVYLLIVLDCITCPYRLKLSS